MKSYRVKKLKELYGVVSI